MYTAAAEITFQAGHYLTLGPDQKEQPHQHDWRIRATVQTPKLDRDSLVIDFHLLSKLLHQAAGPLTQVNLINELPDFTAQNPSTELIARYVYERLAPLLPPAVKLKEVTVWETPQARAAYSP